MTTFDDLIKRAETAERDAGRTVAETEAEIRAIRAKAQEQGRDRFTAAEDAYVTKLTQQHERAKATQAGARAELAQLRDAQGQELRVDELMQRSAADPETAGAGTAGTWRVGQRPGEPPRGDGDGPARWVRSVDGKPAAVGRGARFADHHVVRAHAAARHHAEQAVIGQHGGIGQQVRALTTTGGGSAVVPTEWSGRIIDRARNLAAVLRAGAQIVPMDAKTVQIGRLTGDPTAAFRTEGSPITASDPTFDNVTLDSKTLSALCVGSMEWFQDAVNADELVEEAIAQAIALQLDLVGLYGSITTGAGTLNLPTPPNPRGVLGALLATAPSNVLGAQANGTTQAAATFWSEILDLIYTPRDSNENPNALIWNSKAARLYAKATDTTGQPLGVPADVQALTRYVSNQVPSYTQGTMANVATDVFVGDWRQLLIGQRLDLRIEVLTERYAENGQVGIVAHWRGDIQPARPRAFAVYRAIKGA
ncbi:phage major capsid protein [Micromonospora aurantiaca (nom. illeg.)]|uniref:phage major capsid protein n=1 Tax=Micromonospora aurantiaca (nom. illeg.) TaxID=47850 RepID=UPI003F4A4AB9